jgi:hypothetical protein
MMLLAGLLTGCGPNGSDTQHKPTPPSVVAKPTERVELMPDTSDEFLRRHLTNSDGFEVETRIEYRNGDKAVIKFRDDQTQQSYKRVTKTGTILIEQNYALDGKSITSGQELRADGTLKWKATQDSSGAVRTLTYWWDGTTLFSDKTQSQPGGAYTATYYKKDGKLWVKRTGSKDGVVDRDEQFNDSGKLAATVERSGQNTTATLYRDDGTIQYRQHMTEVPSSYGSYTYKTMQYVEEYAADGKTLVRKLVMNSGGYSVGQVERPNADGTTTVRTLNYNGTVTHEDIRDASGKITSQKDIDPNAGVKESYDYRAVREPSSDDPVSTWNNAERYPYYRR